MSTAVRNKIVLIDDDAALLNGLRRRLGGVYDVTVFSDPTAAIEAVCADPAFPVVVSDMQMPQMDGLTLLRQIHRYCPEMVCMMLTGDGDQELAIKAVNDGYIFRFLKKPCDAAQLDKAIQEAIVEYGHRCRRSGFLYRLVQDGPEIVQVDADAGCRAVTGLNGVDFVRRPQRWVELVAPEDAAAVKAFYAQASAGQLTEPLEYRIRRGDQSVVWVRNTLLSCRAENDGKLALHGQLQDITESKLARMHLERATRRYEKMVANVPGLVFQAILDGSGTFRFTFVSHSCLELLGVTAEQICGDSTVFFANFSPEDRMQFYGKLTDSAGRLSPLVWQGRYTAGVKTRWFQGTARPERLPDGRILWDGLLVDITEQKQNQQRAEYLAQFPEQSPNPVLRINTEGRIIYANSAAATLLTLWDRKLGHILPQDLYEVAVSAAQSARPRKHEVLCGDRYFSIIFLPIAGSGDINLYTRDITDLKTAELELRRSNTELIEHDRLKSEFISTVTHEIRTPLCIFQNILSNAMEGVYGTISPSLKDNLEMAQQGVRRLGRIVSDFLDMSKIEAGSMKLDWQLCSLNELIEDTSRSLKLLAAAKKIRIHTALPEKHVFAFVDKDRIVQVLTNLIGNAIKFIPLRGHIEVQLESGPSAFTIRVGDDGPGLSPEQVRRVFDRFVQFHIRYGPGQQGTGLGLPISRELVRLHGGDITAESSPGQGCVFAFTIPFHTPPQAAMQQEAAVNEK